jgi:eukaryotic-like serine/threonine-protein kinase
VNVAGHTELWVLPVSGDRKAFPYQQTKFTEGFGSLSPGGEWLAYGSDESGRQEVYVQTFPKLGGKWQVSSDGGTRPQWSKDGKELYFISADGKLMSVSIRGSGGRFEAGTPQSLFEAPPPQSSGFLIDISKDGRFLILAPTEESAGAPITVLVNWTAGFTK